MSTVLITYRVLPEHLDEHLTLLRAVHEELRGRRFDRVGWASFRPSA